MCEPAKERKFKRLTLLFRKFLQSSAHQSRPVANLRFVCRSQILLMQVFPFIGYFSAKLFHALADAQPVHCFVARDHYRPGERAAPLRIVRWSFPPNIGESLLQYVLSFFGIIQHPLSHRVQRTGESLVKRCERRFFPVRNPGDQALQPRSRIPDPVLSYRKCVSRNDLPHSLESMQSSRAGESPLRAFGSCTSIKDHDTLNNQANSTHPRMSQRSRIRLAALFVAIWLYRYWPCT